MRAQLGSARRAAALRRVASRRTQLTLEICEPRCLLSADLVAHWTAESLDGYQDGDRISAWQDRVQGREAHAVGNPRLADSLWNGHAAVRFDPSDQIDFFRLLAADNPLAGAQDFSVVAVFSGSVGNQGAAEDPWYLHSGIVDASGFGLVDDWGLAWDATGHVSAGIGNPARTVRSESSFGDGVPHVAVMTRDASQLTLTVNDESRSRTDVGTGPRAARDIKLGGGGFPFAGAIAEVRLYRGSLSPEETARLIGELQDKYVNLPPVVSDLQYAALEDQPLEVTAEGGILSYMSDPENDPLSITLERAPQGDLELAADGSFHYRPPTDFFGIDPFDISITDGFSVQRARVQIAVLAQPDPPRPRPNAYWAVTDTPLEIGLTDGVLANDVHPDALPLSAELAAPAQHGTVEIHPNGAFRYLPRPGYVGIDTFRYRAQDAEGSGSEQSVEIRVQASSVVITEALSRNFDSLRDEDGESSDWLELLNFGGSPTSLRGWYLTDAPDEPTKWPLPARTLAPGERLVVFASGKNRRPTVGELHANFRLSSNGEQLRLVMPDGETVASELAIPAGQLRDVSFGYFDDPLRPGRGESLLTAELSQPTPNAHNSSWLESLGPRIVDVQHQPSVPRPGDVIRITARVTPSHSVRLIEDPVQEVFVRYRLMYGEERVVAMRDDGIAPDAGRADGIFTAEVSGETLAMLARESGLEPTDLPGSMFRYLVTASTTEGRMSQAPPSPANGDAGRSVARTAEYFGTIIANDNNETPLPVLHWFVPDPDWHRTSLGNNTRWSPASVYYAGQFYDNLQVRVRGISTLNWSKPKYKFEFNPGEPFRYQEDAAAVDEFNLQSHFIEKGATSYMGENLAFGFLTDIGVPAPHTFHFHVRQNGEFHSLASFVEQIDATFLARQNYDPFGAMYKANSPAARSTLAVNPSASDYQKVTRQSEGFQDLRELTNGINDRLPEISRSDFLFDQIDLPQVINNMAGNTILTNHDRLTKNYYVYRDTGGTEQWSMFPWDMDQAFAKRTDANFSSILYGDSEHPQATGFPIYQNHLLDAILDTPRTRAMYLRRLRTLFDEYLDAGYFEAEIEKYRTAIWADAAADHQRWQAGTLTQGIARLHDHLSFRRQQLANDPLLPPTAQRFATDTLIDDRSLVRVLPATSPESMGAITADRSEFESPENGWLVGFGGVGYDRGLGYQPFLGQLYRDEDRTDPIDLLEVLDPDQDGVNQTNVVLLRYHFEIENAADYDRLLLEMRYDDAFVAYLNGVEIARSRLAGEPQWDGRATLGNHEASEPFESFPYRPGFFEQPPWVTGDNVLVIVGLNAQNNSPDLLVQPRLHALRPVAVSPSLHLVRADNNPVSGVQAEEYVEIRNQEPVAVDLSHWTLSGDVQFRFAPGTVIPAGESVFVASSPAAFRQRFAPPQGGAGLFVVGPFSGRLDNEGGELMLRDRAGQVSATLRTQAELSPLQKYLRITEIHYHPGDDQELEFVELTNVSGGADATGLSLNGLRWTEGPQAVFVLESGTGEPTWELASGASLVLAKNPAALLAAHPELRPEQVAGPFVGNLSNGGETLRVEDAHGELVTELRYDDRAPWPTLADGNGFSLELQDARQPSGDARNWRPSAIRGGSPGSFAQIAGDLNNNGSLEITDVDLFCSRWGDGEQTDELDLNGDGQVNQIDYETLTRQWLGLRAGDADLNAIFDTRDLVAIFQSGKFERDEQATWIEGDWDCDRRFTTRDLVMALAAGGEQFG